MVNLSCLTHKCVCVRPVLQCTGVVLIIRKNRGSTKGPLPDVLVPMQHNAGEQEQQTPATVTWIYLPPPPDPTKDVKLRFISKAHRIRLHIRACFFLHLEFINLFCIAPPHCCTINVSNIYIISCCAFQYYLCP